MKVKQISKYTTKTTYDSPSEASQHLFDLVWQKALDKLLGKPISGEVIKNFIKEVLKNERLRQAKK